MSVKHKKLAAWLLATCSASASCALFGKSEPLRPRYYTPVADQGQAATCRARSAVMKGALSLRLGRVSSVSSLRERIAYRTESHEMRFRDAERWTERPETYLAQALAQALFEERGLTMVVSGSAPTLEVTLTAFEEILGAAPRVRVEAVVVLHDDTVALLYETVRSERRLPAADAKERVYAFSSALCDLVEQIASHTVTTLSPPTPEPAQP